MSIEGYALSMCKRELAMPLGRLYADAYVKDAVAEDVARLAERIRDRWRERVGKLTWLTSDARSAADAKLAKLKIRVGAPRDWDSYRGLRFASYADGGNLLEYVLACARYRRSQQASLIGSAPDRDVWTVAPQEVRIVYDVRDNSLTVCGGALGGMFYDGSSGESSNLGGIGARIAQAMVGAIDEHGGYADGTGQAVDWWTDANRAAYREQLSAVGDYFSTIEVLGNRLDGERIAETAAADIGGLACALDIAATRDKPQYQSLFRQFARTWRTQETTETCSAGLVDGSAPPAYLRCNASVQQFDAFAKVYDVSSEDGMYLAVDERLGVW